MPIISSDESERSGALEAAKLMAIAARTAPKSGGVDDILTVIVYGGEEGRVSYGNGENREQTGDTWIRSRQWKRAELGSRGTHWGSRHEEVWSGLWCVWICLVS